MLSAGALLKGLIRRFLPSPSQEGPESESYARLLRYQELAVGVPVRKSHLLAEEGSYFTVNNAQTGIAEGANTGFVVTTPTLYVANMADPNDPTAKSVNMDYVDLSIQTAGITATAVQQKQLAVYLARGNNYASAGTELTSKIVNVNPRVAGFPSIAKVYFGALVTTDPAVSKGTTRVVVGQRYYRMPVTATTAPDVVGDRLRLEFGNVEAETSAQFGTTGTLMANVYQLTMKLPPVSIPPGWSMGIYTWTLVSGGTYPTPTVWLPEAGWFER